MVISLLWGLHGVKWRSQEIKIMTSFADDPLQRTERDRAFFIFWQSRCVSIETIDLTTLGVIIYRAKCVVIRFFDNEHCKQDDVKNWSYCDDKFLQFLFHCSIVSILQNNEANNQAWKIEINFIAFSFLWSRIIRDLCKVKTLAVHKLLSPEKANDLQNRKFI